MTRLLGIKETVQQIAEAVTLALGVESEIVDNELTIVAGTGRYKERIGMKEENGDPDSGYIYGRVLRTGKQYIVKDAAHDLLYDPSVRLGTTEEKAEICTPIRLDGEVIGVLGLVAFDNRQQEILLKNNRELLLFIERMAFLIASKVSETEVSNKLRTVLETIHEGIIDVDINGIVTLCNSWAESLLGVRREEIVGRHVNDFLVNSPVMEVMQSGIEYKEKEEIHDGPGNKQMHFLTSIRPVYSSGIEKGTQNLRGPIGAVIFFRDIDDIRKMFYDLTEGKQISSFENILAVSESMVKLIEWGKKIAQSNSTVLITGESGTGKEMFARAIHYESPRGKKPFVVVNCGALPETLLESELFGYEGGAFTGAKKGGKVGKFEMAQGGTIFLDEIGELPLHLQVKLLHVLQRKEIERVGGNRVVHVDVRIIAATNRNLEKMMQDGEFREDLYFRLNVIPVYIPPLRERREDIKPLLEYSLHKYTHRLGKEIVAFSDEVLEMLHAYDWPGNVRELENLVEYCVNLEDGEVITFESLPPRMKRGSCQVKELSLKERMDSYEKKLIEDCLNIYGRGVEGKRKAAQSLKISLATLYRKINEYSIE